MAGFMVAAPIIVFISGGKQAVLGVLIAGVVLTPVFWITNVHNEFLDNCILRRASTTTPTLDTQVAIPLLGNEQVNEQVAVPVLGNVPKHFFNFSGRTGVWKEGLRLFSDSPVLGYGFHADRLLLGTHAHNSFVHSLMQTGVLGTIPFVVGLILAWVLLLRAGLNLYRFSQNNKALFIQATGVLVFLSVRSVYESTGAFFGVDWLLLGPLLIYLQAVNSSRAQNDIGSPKARILDDLRGRIFLSHGPTQNESRKIDGI